MGHVKVVKKKQYTIWFKHAKIWAFWFNPKKNEPAEKLYAIGTALKGYGHDVLRLPPNMAELNLIEFVWVETKRRIHKSNVKSISSSLYSRISCVLKLLYKINNFYWKKTLQDKL